MNAIEISDRRRLRQSGLISLALWVCVAAAALLAPMRRDEVKKPTYTSVAITLTAPSASEPRVVTVSPVAEPDVALAPPSAEPAPPAPAKDSAPKAPSAKPKAASSAPSAAPASSQGLGIPNFSSPIASAPSDADETPERLEFSSAEETTRPQSASKPKGGAQVAELEGQAAAVAKNPSGTGSVTGVATGTVPGKAPGAANATAETQSALAAISASASSSGTGAQGAATPRAAVETARSAPITEVTGLSFEGAGRGLLYPAKPAITLPESLARLVDSDRAVTVSFTVRPDGSVPASLISFTPSAILPVEIRDYLKREFSSWRFEKGSADGQARFQYSIKMK